MKRIVSVMAVVVCVGMMVCLTGCGTFGGADAESMSYLAGQGIVAGYVAGKDKLTPEQIEMVMKVSDVFEKVGGVLGSDTANMKQSIDDALKANIKDAKQYALAQQFADICWEMLNKNVDLQKVASDTRVKVVLSFCKGINDGLKANKDGFKKTFK